MSLLNTINTMELVQTGPGLRDRLEKWIAARHHKAVVAKLRDFREQLREDAKPDSWVAVEAPLVLILMDMCIALGFDIDDQATVLGIEGLEAVLEILETRPALRSRPLINERQAQALRHVRRHGSITNGEFQELSPDVSAETLRLDLADLVTRGLLAKNGRKKGTRYVLPQ